MDYVHSLTSGEFPLLMCYHIMAEVHHSVDAIVFYSFLQFLEKLGHHQTSNLHVRPTSAQGTAAADQNNDGSGLGPKDPLGAYSKNYQDILNLFRFKTVLGQIQIWSGFGTNRTSPSLFWELARKWCQAGLGTCTCPTVGIIRVPYLKKLVQLQLLVVPTFWWILASPKIIEKSTKNQSSPKETVLQLNHVSSK